MDPCTRDECKADWDLTLIKQFVAKHFSDVEPNPSITEMCMYTVRQAGSVNSLSYPSCRYTKLNIFILLIYYKMV